MDSGYINQLLNIITSPYGAIGIIIGVAVLLQARRSRRLAWLFFTLCCFAASLGKYQDEWVKQPPALVFPLEQLREMGRPLTIILLGLVLFLGLQTQNTWRRVLLAQPVKYLIIVQTVFFFKILFEGSLEFACLAGMTFGAVILMIRLGPSRWLHDGQNFYLAVWSLAMVGTIFSVANAYQAAINIYPITFIHGRFNGTTGNAQHAAVLLAATVPCLMFLIESRKRWDWVKTIWIVSLFLVAYFLLLTGSRTGAIMSVASILLFYRHKVSAIVRLGLFASVLLSLLFWFVTPDIVTSAPLTNRFIAGENTREGAWLGMWTAFINNPFFGAPLQGDRLVFGESSWLATGATVGLIGFIPLVLFGLECIKMILQLIKISKHPNFFLQSSTVIAGLSSFLVGSFSEAILLGNLSFPLLSLLLYLSLGKYLIDVNNLNKI